MRILITGGFGYIGSRLAQHLHQNGLEVVLCSRDASVPPDWLPQATVQKISWCDTEAIELMCLGVDVVIHAAGMNAQDCIADPVGALEFNGLATARLLEASIRVKVKRFIYLSTAHVYASPLLGIISEDTFPRNLHPYATSHLAGEYAVLNASRNAQIVGLVLRLSNAYGIPAHNKSNCNMLLFNDLCQQAVSDRKMTLNSSGLQRRDFVAVTDVCSAIAHIIRLSNDALKTRLFNVGGGWTPTVWEAACLIRDRCKDILGYCPVLTRQPASYREVTSALDFRIDTLLHTGYRLSADRIFEIDSLIKFYRQIQQFDR